MELILINNGKLKIMLTEEDMREYELDCDMADYDNTETRRAFWNILAEAKARTGFDAASERVFIQLYPSKAGGCEIYVTKIGLRSGPEKKITGQQSSCGTTKTPPDGTGEIMQIAFMFEGISQLIAACRLAATRGVITESQVWLDERGAAYLFAESHSEGIDSAYLTGVFGEFGSAIENPNIASYIKEHGRPLCTENAVNTLATF